MLARGRRPEGTDGSDHVYRMIIENKYKRIAILKKYGRYLHIFQAVLIMILVLWYSVPMLYGDYYPVNGLILLAIEMLTILSYQFAAIGTSREKMPLVKTYGVLMAVLTAEHMLLRWWYHVKMPKSELFPHLLAKYIGVGLVENTDHLRVVLTVWEASLDVALFFVLLAGSFWSRSYVQEKCTPDNPLELDKKQEVDRIKQD